MAPVQVSCAFAVVCVLLCCAGYVGAQDSDGAPTSLTKCWECMNFDPAGNFYSQCPMNDSVDPVRAYLGNCTGKCFTHTDDLNPELIIRGCTASQWGLPDPLPADGCYPWYSEIWCVCSKDGCNGVKLKKEGTVQFDAHIDYTKPQGGNSASVPVFSPVTCLLALVVCAACLWRKN